MESKADNSSIECPFCHASVANERLVARRGDLESYECNDCGKPIWLSVSRAQPNLRVDGNCVVKVHWAGSGPTSQEIRAIRRLHRPFQQIPLAELKASVESTIELDIGVFGKGEAQDILKRAGDLGLKATIEDV